MINETTVEERPVSHIQKCANSKCALLMWFQEQGWKTLLYGPLYRTGLKSELETLEKKSFCTNKNVFKKSQILYVCKLYYIQGTYF